MSEWIITKLRNIAKVKGGKRMPKGETFESAATNYKYIRLVDCKERKPDIENAPFISEKIFNQLKHYEVKGGELYISVVGTIGIIGIIPYLKKRAILTENANKILPIKSDISVQYLYYFLKSPLGTKEVFKGLVGSIQPKLPIYNIENIEVHLPSYFTQQKIAAVLSALDDKIELNNRINAELEAMAKTLYDYWFVQFDFPDAAGQPYKTAGGNMVWNERLKRNIPEGWKVKTLQDFIAADKNGDWGKEEPEGNYQTKVQCIRGTDINGINGKGDLKAPIRFILEKNEHKILAPADLVIEISGGSPIQSTGRLACITNEAIERFESPLICSNFCKAVSLKEENKLFYFVHAWNKAYDNGLFFGFEGKTSGIKNLLFDTLVSTYCIVEPPEELLDRFQNTVSVFEKQRQKNLKQNDELAALRDWLLPMLMNGQVSVGETYAQAEEVLNMAAEEDITYHSLGYDNHAHKKV